MSARVAVLVQRRGGEGGEGTEPELRDGGRAAPRARAAELVAEELRHLASEALVEVARKQPDQPAENALRAGDLSRRAHVAHACTMVRTAAVRTSAWRRRSSSA